jgi:excisionase family DNA binding protein
MTVGERVAELLAGVPPEDTLRGRAPEEAGKFLGVSTATVYRFVGEGKLGCIKVEGGSRRGRGCAGLVRVRLLDCIKFMVEHERTPGGAIKKTKGAKR